MRKDLRKKFKKYLESKSALCIYMKMYRERHLSVNPARLEDFLEQTTPNLAIPGAFVYPSSKLSVYDRDFWLALHEGWLDLLETTQREEEEMALLGDVDFIDVEKRIAFGMGPDTASLNQRAGYRLTFNQAHTKLIAESGLKLVALGQSRTTGEVLLMINNQRGITYNISEHPIRSASMKTITHKNVVVSAKDLCQKLSRMLCIKSDYELLECKMVSKNVSMIIFKLDTKL